MPRQVKTGGASPRRYDARARRQRAELRRQQVIESARARFQQDGFAATTMAALAADAEVSVEFVYKAFGSKAGVVRAIWEQALRGQQPRAAEARSDEVSQTAEDPRVILRNWARLSAEVSAVGAPIHALVKAAAATDHEAAALLEEIEESRRKRMQHNTQYLVRGRHLRPGVSPEQARDILMLGAGELYEILVLRYGWPTEPYIELVYTFLRASLLPDSYD
jgi:AcrR family transcriptional regulator